MPVECTLYGPLLSDTITPLQSSYLGIYYYAKQQRLRSRKTKKTRRCARDTVDKHEDCPPSAIVVKSENSATQRLRELLWDINLMAPDMLNIYRCLLSCYTGVPVPPVPTAFTKTPGPGEHEWYFRMFNDWRKDLVDGNLPRDVRTGDDIGMMEEVLPLSKSVRRALVDKFHLFSGTGKGVDTVAKEMSSHIPNRHDSPRLPVLVY